MAQKTLSELQENFTCLAIVCVDFIKLPLKEILDNHVKPSDLYAKLNSSTLITGNKLRSHQKNLCYITPPGIPDYSKFDVSLLYTLIRNLCPSLKPTGRWGEEPAAAHTQLGDDIERLRCFRNREFAHANSAEISDGEFKKHWSNLHAVINRIQSNKHVQTDFLQRLNSIKEHKLNCEDFEKYKDLLVKAALRTIQEREGTDEPDIWIEGPEKVVCGSTACFKATVKEKIVTSCSVTWQKEINNEIKQIDPRTSNNEELCIESVCKDDEGEYQAVLSFKEHGFRKTVESNSIFLQVEGGILNSFYQDRGARAVFAMLFNEVAEKFPERKLKQLKHLIYHSCKEKDKELSPSFIKANSARDYFKFLEEEGLFTPSDVIFVQFLLRESDCGELYEKCIEYATTQKGLCFYEEPPRNGYKVAKFHVQGDISNYTAVQIGIIKETVAAIVKCDKEEIHLNGLCNSTSFFVVLSIKESCMEGLFNMKEQDKEKLISLNINYFIVDSCRVYLQNSKGGENMHDEQMKMVYPEMLKKEEEFQLLHKASCLPRYTYHWSLIEWYMEGLPKDIIFTGCHLESCLIFLGGIITDEEKKVLFGESALSEGLDVKGLQKEAENYTAFLIVYFFNGDLIKMGEDIEKLDRILPFKDGHGHVLVVMEMKYSCDREIIIEGIRTIGITKVEVVMKKRSIIVQTITCILEQMLSSYLVGTKKTLLDHSHTHYVDSSLLEVNAILKRLKQAKCYPEPLAEIVGPENNEINNILQRFPEKIIYNVQDGNTLYIIASDQATKISLETLLSGLGFQNISFVVTVEDKMPISELSKTGVPLHGAKFVYVNLGTEAFNTDECFATTGSLMQANNNSLMVAVTCRHALEREDHFYTLIENSVVRLGEEIKQPKNNMERLHDDISVVRIDDETRSIVDEKCEKLLIDTSKLPSPAQISNRTLVKGDIVHKRGARTGLTTGIVRDVRTQQIGRFSEQSPVIFITGRDSIPFAEKGDSGSLVFQHSLDPEEKRLDVLAMVQGKVNVPIRNADVICFPFIEGCKNLQNHIPDIQNLDFFNH